MGQASWERVSLWFRSQCLSHGLSHSHLRAGLSRAL